jgi:BirA family biotin operon repressor/biotin-[acetyl-CoA-carboxylase] ligase
MRRGTARPPGSSWSPRSRRRGAAGRDRTWSAPARSGLTFSVLLRPSVPVAELGWLPLLAGLAVAEAVARLAELDVRLKWPNDLLVGDRKLAGVLAERVGGAVVVGIGLNVTTTAAELPVATATSLVIEGAACTDREPLLRAILRRLAERYAEWDGPGGDPGLADGYRGRCATLGREVRAELPGGGTVVGTAESSRPRRTAGDPHCDRRGSSRRRGRASSALTR